MTADGSRQVSPERDTTYELLAIGPGGQVRHTASVTVVPGQTAAPHITVGTIQGSVLDPTGAPVAGAAVTAIGSPARNTVMTDAKGQFVFQDVPAGMYQLQITTAGFKTRRIENVAVAPGRRITLNSVMEVGETPSAVTVSGPGTGPEPPPVRERLVIRLADIPAPMPANSELGAAYNRLRVGAYRFELPELRRQERSLARLLVDANPMKVATEGEWRTALAQPGNLAAQPVKISESMTATLSAGEGVSIRPLSQSPDGKESVFVGRLTKWNWELTPLSAGTHVITLDLRAKIGTAYEHVDPFPIVQQKTVIPSTTANSGPTSAPAAAAANETSTTGRGFPWLWLIGLLLAIAGAAGVLLWRRRRGGHALAVRTSGLLTPRLLVIHGMEERQNAEKFCERLRVKECEYVYGLSGFPVGSPEWQREFDRGLSQADGVIVLLTGAALGEQWVNWQVERAMRQQSGRGTPIYPVLLDEKVSRAASTLGRLSAFSWLNASREQDLDELKERVEAIQPAPTRLVKCFISYSRKTQQEIDTAVRLEADLEQMGYQCFRDLTDLRGGEEWEQVIRNQLAAATHLLVLVTQSSAQSRWVLKEILWAEGKTIIPLMSAGVDLPEELRRFQGIPFSDYDTGLTALLQTLQQYHPSRKAGAA